MTGNLMPWIILAAVVLATLTYKGYFKLPSAPAVPPGPSSVGTTWAMSHSAPSESNIDGLAKLGSYVLGLALARAVRSEAEATIGGTFAREAAEALHAKFTAPFSAPAPAPTAGPAGGPPNP